MRIVATSDLHGSLPEIPECDLLLIGGDVCPDYIRSSRRPGVNDISKGESEQSGWLEDTFAPWLEEQPAKQIVGIAGNHDFVFEHKFLVPTLPWVYLEDQSATVMGLRIYGLPWVPNLPFWAFYGNDTALKLAYEAVTPCDILLSHGPPKGYGDACGPKYGLDGQSVGCQSANFAIQRAKPMLYVNGHIHEGYGEYSHAGCRVLNVAHNDGDYNPVNAPVVIDL